MPVYYVIGEYHYTQSGYSVVFLLEVIECTLDDVNSGRVNVRKYNEAGHYNVVGFVFSREPDNPFRKEVGK